ncbi:hypothetical protein M433DRAFT_132685 [Acidomyces richmondensis BFW]|nr:MAG: hypothetical protein FE78DRAFT_140431 [Acidomyces sp. 'richmondensis']KYG47772.1 hypothetical protein M433DRAFT_132685 [Acidomyces richmondensis BFW]
MADDHIADVPPPLQDLPSAKEKKYDRQLRLWGAAGQVALEETHVLLINNGPGVAGVEALKNLILPGIGQFTILDAAIVNEADLGVNFFLDDASLGKFRATETVKMLMELNPSVKGHAVTEPLASFITKDGALLPYNLLIVAAPIDPTILSHILAHAETSDIPTFYLHSVGYFASFSVLLPRVFPIVDTHPDPTATSDLRLLTPWPALSEFAKEKTAGLGRDAMSQHEKAHIPWICLLLYYLEVWKKEHDGKVPLTFAEKTQFRKLVRSGDLQEENFDEACAAVVKAITPHKLSSAAKEILAAPEAQNLTSTSPAFWVIANAIGRFVDRHGELPLPGAVPDMKAQSAEYIQLQNIYKSKAREDSAEVLATVREIEKQTHRSPTHTIDEKEVENFCKGAAHIHLVRGRPLQIVRPGEPVRFSDRAKAMAMQLTTPDSLFGLYIAFLAWDHFVATHYHQQPTSSNSVAAPAAGLGEGGFRMPGSGESDFETDVAKVTGIAHKILDGLLAEAATMGEEPPESAEEAREHVSEYCRELVRAGGGELHNMASLLGGLLAQEVIKVVTRQYIPIDNTCVFDGVGSRSQVFRL